MITHIYRIERKSCHTSPWEPLSCLFSSLELAKDFIKTAGFYRYRVERMKLDNYPETWKIVEVKE
jgi:hypothetical protein